MRVLPLMVMAVLLLAADRSGAEGMCCDDQMCCTNAACCKHDARDAAPGQMGLGVIPPGSEWPADAAAQPVREYAKVYFNNPVRVAGYVLIGAYVIEHDNERMARGLPCTHIYAANDRRLPVVAFHCRHLDRKATERATVTLRRISDPTTRMFELVEFQFEDSADGHGVPNGRR